MGTEERYLQGSYFQGLSQASHSFQVLCSPISFLSLTRNPISLSAPNTKFLICIKPLVVGYFCLCVQLFWFESFTNVSGETQKAGDLRGLLPTHPLTIYSPLPHHGCCPLCSGSLKTPLPGMSELLPTSQDSLP